MSCITSQTSVQACDPVNFVEKRQMKHSVRLVLSIANKTFVQLLPKSATENIFLLECHRVPLYLVIIAFN